MSEELILRSRWSDVVIPEGNLTDLVLNKTDEADYDKVALVSYAENTVFNIAMMYAYKTI